MSATDQRSFTIVYNDFLESSVLDAYEKLVFIAIKKFADNNTMMAFPSLKTICSITKLSLSKVSRCIKNMIDKGVLTKENRKDDIKGNQSNLYTLYDYAEIWNKTNNSLKDIKEDLEIKKIIDLLCSKGYKVKRKRTRLQLAGNKLKFNVKNKNFDKPTKQIIIKKIREVSGRRYFFRRN